MEMKFKINDTVRSLLPEHRDSLRFWRVSEVEIGERTGKPIYTCKSTSDELKSRHDADAITYDFRENEIELS